jgi:hypothetical protein
MNSNADFEGISLILGNLLVNPFHLLSLIGAGSLENAIVINLDSDDSKNLSPDLYSTILTASHRKMSVFIFALQGEQISPTIRNNASRVIFTTYQSLISYFTKKSNNLAHHLSNPLFDQESLHSSIFDQYVMFNVKSDQIKAF